MASLGVSLEYLLNYLLFIAKFLSVIFVLVAALVALAASRQKNKIEVLNLNNKYTEQAFYILSFSAPAKFIKAQKKRLKGAKKEERPCLYVLDFNGDVSALEVEQLRDEISYVLIAAKRGDSVLLRLQSPGGTVNGYGLAAAQLERIKSAGFRLEIMVDSVAASGGYMMAAVADRIYCAPLAIIGSIGVIGSLPNFNRFLKEHKIDYEQHTAGKFKRSLTVLGENNEEGREKFKQDLEGIHKLFKSHISSHRPHLDLDKVATGEYWFGRDALALELVDEIKTSDALIIERIKSGVLVLSVSTPKPRPNAIKKLLAQVLSKISLRLEDKPLARL